MNSGFQAVSDLLMEAPAVDSSAESTPSTNAVVEASMSPFRSAEPPASGAALPFGGSESAFPPCGGRPFALAEESPFVPVDALFGSAGNAPFTAGSLPLHNPFSTDEKWTPPQGGGWDGAAGEHLPFSGARPPVEEARLEKREVASGGGQKLSVRRKKKGRTPKYLLRRQMSGQRELEGEEKAVKGQKPSDDSGAFHSSTICSMGPDEAAEKNPSPRQEELQFGEVHEVLVSLRQHQEGKRCDDWSTLSENGTFGFQERVESEHSVEDVLATIAEMVAMITEANLVFPHSVGSGMLAYCIINGNESEHGELLASLLTVVPFASISSSGHIESELAVLPPGGAMKALLFAGEEVQPCSNTELQCSRWSWQCSPLLESLRYESRLWAYRLIVERLGPRSPLMASLYTIDVGKSPPASLLETATQHGTIDAVLADAPGLLFLELMASPHLLSLVSPSVIKLMWKSVIVEHERVLAADPFEFPLMKATPPKSLKETIDFTMSEMLSSFVLNRILFFVASAACGQPSTTISPTPLVAVLQDILLHLPEWFEQQLKRSMAEVIALDSARAGSLEVTLLLLSHKAFSEPLSEETARTSLLNAAFEGRNLQLAKEVLKKGKPLDLIRVVPGRHAAKQPTSPLYAALLMADQWAVEVLIGNSEEFPLTEKDLDEVRKSEKDLWKVLRLLLWREEDERRATREQPPTLSQEEKEILVREEREVRLKGLRLMFDILETLGLTDYDLSVVKMLSSPVPSVHVASVLTERIPHSFFLREFRVGRAKVETVFSYLCPSLLKFALALAEEVPEMLERLTREVWDSSLPSNEYLPLDAPLLLRLLPHIPVEELIKRDIFGRTALHNAVARGKGLELIQQMRIMLPAEAVYLKDNDGNTPLDVLSPLDSGRDRATIVDILAPTWAKRAV